MLGEYLSAAATLAVGLLAAVQWYFSWRAQARQRDSDLTAWGGEVLDIMAELEVACESRTPGYLVSPETFERLGWKASALVDKGRLFFPNVKESDRPKDDEGTRVKLLDEVLRTCYVARYAASVGTADGRRLRSQVWQARGRFIKLLQAEMSASLRPVTLDARGEKIPLDPSKWPKPVRALRLPGDELEVVPSSW